MSSKAWMTVFTADRMAFCTASLLNTFRASSSNPDSSIQSSAAVRSFLYSSELSFTLCDEVRYGLFVSAMSSYIKYDFGNCKAGPDKRVHLGEHERRSKCARDRWRTPDIATPISITSRSRSVTKPMLSIVVDRESSAVCASS